MNLSRTRTVGQVGCVILSRPFILPWIDDLIVGLSGEKARKDMGGRQISKSWVRIHAPNVLNQYEMI